MDDIEHLDIEVILLRVCAGRVDDECRCRGIVELCKAFVQIVANNILGFKEEDFLASQRTVIACVG